MALYFLIFIIFYTDFVTICSWYVIYVLWGVHFEVFWGAGSPSTLEGSSYTVLISHIMPAAVLVQLVLFVPVYFFIFEMFQGACSSNSVFSLLLQWLQLQAQNTRLGLSKLFACLTVDILLFTKCVLKLVKKLLQKTVLSCRIYLYLPWYSLNFSI